MTNILILILLFALQLFYFKLAERFNIIDKPNLRSSHTEVTLRGGGIIFYVGTLIFFFQSNFEYASFFLGLTLITAISFLDDIFTLSNRVRLLFHFICVLLLFHQLELFGLSWYHLVITFVVFVGVVNAYNFMDGINGITASYSLAVGGLLVIINQDVRFIEEDFLIYTMFGVIVFAFFNFRTKAKCFAGDVGSVAIAYIWLFALGSLIVVTGKPIYILLLTVYGVDSVSTIVRRLYLRENIFKAHRSHLYQLLANEAGINKLLVSFLYGALQFIIGLFVIYLANLSSFLQGVFSFCLLGIVSAGYLLIKNQVEKKYIINKL